MADNGKWVRLGSWCTVLALLLLVTGVVPAGAAGGTATNACEALTGFQPTNFPNPTAINHQFYPLTPGTQFVLEGSINAGGTAAHRVIFTVTDLVKLIDGVLTRVLWDQDINDGVLVESELAFQAQDSVGNVWVMGEYPEEYEDGVFVGAPSTWIGGLNGARAGVLVPGVPVAGTAPFIQAKAMNVGFWDCGQVFATNQTVAGPKNTYTGVLVINEWDPLDNSGGIQQKFYAPNTGLVQVGAVNDPEAEVLVLTKRVQLSPHALAQARAAALQLESRAYEVSDTYRKTAPAQPQ